MVHHDVLRQSVLILTGVIFTFYACWTLFRPHSLARILGYQLNNHNAKSEFHAIYIGVFLAQAVLCVFAGLHIEQVLLGDLVAIFVLSQPVGRIVALFRNGFPKRQLRLITITEIVGGILLLLIRPSLAL
ncbi:hypothetical protein FGF1_25480 [Flavobacteriaceae bacterium GF1]